MDAMAQSTIPAGDGTELAVYRWAPAEAVRGIVQIAHGMAEHGARYDRFARALADAGYAVYANDHRGHGRTAGDVARLGHFADRDGWATAVSDLVTLTRLARSENPGVPVVLFGHSMGSYLARAYAIDHGRELAGLILSAAGGDPGVMGRIGRAIAALEARIRGKRARSVLLDRLSFGRYNSAFTPNRTRFDWLSRDEASVDAYLADPYCGAVSTATFFGDLLAGVGYVNDAANVSRVPRNLPIYLMSGEKDPVGEETAGVMRVIEQFQKAGVRDVTWHFYPDARHELLNETNRDEVYADVIGWLDTHVGPAAPTRGQSSR